MVVESPLLSEPLPGAHDIGWSAVQMWPLPHEPYTVVGETAIVWQDAICKESSDVKYGRERGRSQGCSLRRWSGKTRSLRNKQNEVQGDCVQADGT